MDIGLRCKNFHIRDLGRIFLYFAIESGDFPDPVKFQRDYGTFFDFMYNIEMACLYDKNNIQEK